LSSILIIDDDVTILARLAAQLEDAGYTVARSSDLRHGELLYAEQRPAMVILEVRSGDGGGWELLGRLAAEAPVIVLSGAANEEDVVRALEEGAVDHIAKPYRSAELLARVRLRMAERPAPAAMAATIAPPRAETPADAPPRPRTSTPPAELTVADALYAHRATQRKNPRGAPADERVFMSEAEEMALLRTPPAEPRPADSARATVAQPDLALEPGEVGLGQRMRAERLHRHLTLVQIENELKIRMSYLQAMEDDKLTLLPRGPTAPQMVKDYADFLGLDASAALEELRAQHYGEAAPPIRALGGTPAPRPLPRWLIILAAVLLALAVCVGAILLFDPGFFLRLPEFFQGLGG
jgi:DNA-binding response OmpR family regulator